MEEKGITLMTTYIEDYDQLRKDYEDWCDEMDDEPEDNGELAWHDENVEVDWSDFKSEVKTFDENNPNTYFLCVGSYTSRYGFPRSGAQAGGAVVYGLLNTVHKLIEGKDDFEFKLNEKGQIEFHGGHHDGSCSYTITRLNKRAHKVIDKVENEYGSLIGNRELCEKLDKEFFAKKITIGKDLYA